MYYLILTQLFCIEYSEWLCHQHMVWLRTARSRLKDVLCLATQLLLRCLWFGKTALGTFITLSAATCLPPFSVSMKGFENLNAWKARILPRHLQCCSNKWWLWLAQGDTGESLPSGRLSIACTCTASGAAVMPVRMINDDSLRAKPSACIATVICSEHHSSCTFAASPQKPAMRYIQLIAWMLWYHRAWVDARDTSSWSTKSWRLSNDYGLAIYQLHLAHLCQSNSCSTDAHHTNGQHVQQCVP